MFWFFQPDREVTLSNEKRYLGNTNTLEVHDTDAEQTNCQLDEIKPDHRLWYDSLSEAKQDKSYDNCAWCIGASTR